jgi:hypothetical protein
VTDRKAIERWENEGGLTLAVMADSSIESNHVTFQNRSLDTFPCYDMRVQDPDRVDHGPEGNATRLAQLTDEYV